MHNLLQTWVDEGRPTRSSHSWSSTSWSSRSSERYSRRICESSKARANRGIADEVEDGDLEEFDLDVAKAVLLLQHVHDIVPLNEGNIAVSVMSDLNGRSWISTQNRVEESLGRLRSSSDRWRTRRGAVPICDAGRTNYLRRYGGERR